MTARWWCCGGRSRWRRGAAVIWLSSNITIGDMSIAGHMVSWLNPLGLLIGLNGVILFAYIVAIPANEIVVPTILMLTMTVGATLAGAQPGVMLALDDAQVYTVLTQVGGWTLLTAVNLMLFSLLHNPCSTTIMTIWNETKNRKWTAVATLLPLGLAFAVTFFTASVGRGCWAGRRNNVLRVACLDETRNTSHELAKVYSTEKPSELLRISAIIHWLLIGRTNFWLCRQ